MRGEEGGGADREAVTGSLRAALPEAGCTAIMNGLTDPFMIPYALALGATSFQAGLLSSVRNLLVSLVQLGSGEAVRRCGSRRAVVLWTAALQALLWVPLAMIGPLLGRWAVVGLIACYTIGTASAALGLPAWGSLMAEYLDPERRGEYFGRRARIAGLCATVAGLVAGGVLQLFAHRPVVGFGLLCAGAGLSRLASWGWLRRLHEEPWREEPHERFSFWEFVRQLPSSNFARFSVCLGAFNFSVHVAAPFFAVYMLRELHYGYLTYTAVVLTASVTGFVMGPWWGKVGDRFGNHAVVRWTTIGIGVLPALWVFSGHPAAMALWNMTGAFLWGGLTLSSTNFLYDAVSAPKRHTCLAYVNVINGIGISLGALAGGWAAETMPPVGGNALASVFLGSAILRLLAAAAFPRLVREVRDVAPATLRETVGELRRAAAG